MYRSNEAFRDLAVSSEWLIDRCLTRGLQERGGRGRGGLLGVPTMDESRDWCEYLLAKIDKCNQSPFNNDAIA